MRKREKRISEKLALLSVIAVLFMFVSCNVEEVQPITEQTERVDIVINGNLTSAVNEQTTNLVTYAVNPTPILNAEEKKVTVDLGAGHSIDFIFYHRYLSDPLEETFQYGAFSLDAMDDRAAYVVAEYYINGVKKYSTISSLVKGIAQYNVVRANNKNTYYLFNVEDLKLFEVANEDLRPNVKSINIHGTFTMQK